MRVIDEKPKRGQEKVKQRAPIFFIFLLLLWLTLAIGIIAIIYFDTMPRFDCCLDDFWDSPCY